MVSRDGLADGPVDDVEVLLRGFLSADAYERFLGRAPNLRWVHSASAGVEGVLTPEALRREIVVTNARGVFSEPIAEYVLLMILAVSRRLPQLLELQRERTWQPLVGVELRDVTVGIVGLGSIGRAVADLAASFGCRVVATRRRPIDPAGSGGGADAAGNLSGYAAGEPVLEPPRRETVHTLGGPEALPALLGAVGFRRPRAAADPRDREPDRCRGARRR